MKQITEVTVTYEDGSTQTWLGHGSVREIRTPAEAQGTPVLKDTDLSFVSAVLCHDRVPQGEGGAPTAPGGARD